MEKSTEKGSTLSFARDILVDHVDPAMVQGVIALAYAFKRKVIAEGVEKPENTFAKILIGFGAKCCTF